MVRVLLQAGVPYKFNIVNLVKPDSLYNAGMRPLLYSVAQARQPPIPPRGFDRWHCTQDSHPPSATSPSPRPGRGGAA
jgi:hypothetical protein